MASRSVVPTRCAVSATYDRVASLSTRPAQLKVGILSDIQYANLDDAAAGSGKKRYHRNALSSVEQAVSSWTLQNVNCVVNLGDIIDAHNIVTDTSEQALQAVLDVFAKLPSKVDVLHVLGNHCVCHPVERECLLDTLGMLKCHSSPDDRGYYATEPVEGWKMIVLDGCDVSTYAWDKAHPKYRAAYEILSSKQEIKLLPDNSNLKMLLTAKSKGVIKEDQLTSSLEGLDKRFVFFNGAVGEEQMEWFRQELEHSKAAEQNVLVFCHMPLLPGICRPGMLLWNYEEVLDTMHDYRDRVKGVFCGHAHDYGFKTDVCGIPHMVLPAVVETAPGTDAHGVIEVYSDRIIVGGFSRPDMIWDFAAQKKWESFAGRMASPAGV